MTIEQNKRAMKRFEKMINTNDQALAQELISDTALFKCLFPINRSTVAKDICRLLR